MCAAGRGGSGFAAGSERSVTEDDAVDCENVRACATPPCGGGWSKMGEIGVLGSLIDELLEVEGRESDASGAAVITPSDHDLRQGEIIACMLVLDPQ